MRNRYINGALWFIGTSRNAFAVIGGCFVTYLLEKYSSNPFTLTGKPVCCAFCYIWSFNIYLHEASYTSIGVIDSQLPALVVPSFSINRLDCHNNTVHLGFGDICAELGIGIILIPLINILQLIAIAKAFCKIKVWLTI